MFVHRIKKINLHHTIIEQNEFYSGNIFETNISSVVAQGLGTAGSDCKRTIWGLVWWLSGWRSLMTSLTTWDQYPGPMRWKERPDLLSCSLTTTKAPWHFPLKENTKGLCNSQSIQTMADVLEAKVYRVKQEKQNWEEWTRIKEFLCQHACAEVLKSCRGRELDKRTALFPATALASTVTAQILKDFLKTYFLHYEWLPVSTTNSKLQWGEKVFAK